MRRNEGFIGHERLARRDARRRIELLRTSEPNPIPTNADVPSNSGGSSSPRPNGGGGEGVVFMADYCLFVRPIRRHKQTEAREPTGTNTKRASHFFGMERAVRGTLAPDYSNMLATEASALIWRGIARRKVDSGNEACAAPLQIGIGDQRSGKARVEKRFSQKTIDPCVKLSDYL